MSNAPDSFAAINDSPKSGTVTALANDRTAVLILLAGLLRSWRTAHYRLPSGMPDGVENAAAWFLDYFCEPKAASEHAVKLSTGAWQTPYADRVRYVLNAFLALSDDDRTYVLAVREERIFWRGDAIDVFHRIVSETLHYRGLDAPAKGNYRTAAIGQLGANRDARR